MNRKKNIIEKLKMDDVTLDKKVKLVGTDFDRRRKLSNSDIRKINRLYDSGYSISYIADVFCVTPYTITYHVDENFRNYINTKRAEYGYKKITSKQVRMNTKERTSYKRELISKGVL